MRVQRRKNKLNKKNLKGGGGRTATTLQKVHKTFRYFGGKNKLVTPIVDIINKQADAYKYLYDKTPVLIEPFCGSAVISFNVPSHKFSKIIINDKSRAITSYFRCVKQNHISLIEKIEELSETFCRDKFYEYRDLLEEDNVEELTRAAMFFMVLNSSYLARADKGTTYALDLDGKDEEYEIEKIVDRAKKRIPANHFRMLNYNIVVENMDYKNLMDKYKDEDRIIYLDPPYAPETLQYKSSGGRSGTPKKAPYICSFTSEDIVDCINLLKEEKYIVCSFYDPKSLFNPEDKEYRSFDELERTERGFWKEM